MDLSAFVSVASLLLWAGAFIYFRAYLKRRTGAERLLAELREEVEKLVSEIDAATDRDATLVEERVRSLRAFLEEADRRIASYGRELDRRAAEERAYAELGRRSRAYRGSEGELFGGSPQAPAVSPARPGAVQAEAVPLPPPLPPLPLQPPSSAQPLSPAQPPSPAQPLSSTRPAPPPPAQPRGPSAEPSIDRASSAETAAGAAPPEPGPRFVRSESPIEPKAASFAERVAELYRAGFSADIIAKRLGATVAEVD